MNPRYIMHRCFILLVAVAGLAVLSLPMYALLTPPDWSVALAVAVGTGCIIYIVCAWIYKPYKDTERMLGLFADGYIFSDVDEIKNPLSPGMHEAIIKMKETIDTNELISSARKQAQYIALQNQINPHFLYNTLEGIRGEAISAGMDNIASMTETMATFYRYTISNVDRLVTLEEELANVESYYDIQRFRFGDRIALEIDCEDDTRHCRMPKLTLQPIMENAIIHGIEQKMGRGEIRISVNCTESRLIIMVSDNGMGMAEAQLNALNRRLGTPSFDYEKPQGEERGGIAIVNVNNRIKLLFGEEYGVVIYSSPGVGTDVELTLPRVDNDGDANEA